MAQDPAFPYRLGEGTSFATPFVTGTAALLLARNLNLSYAQLKDLILDNVDSVPALAGKTVSGGRLNVYKALAATPAAVANASGSLVAALFSTTTRVSAAKEQWLASADTLLT